MKDNGCDLVIVLSHLGYWDNDTRGDRMVAVNSTDVDMIIGGHTHTALGEGIDIPNKDGKNVKIVQAGGRGYLLGNVKIVME